MKKIYKMGNVDWKEAEMRERLEEFNELFKRRPRKHNIGGMHASHLFACWFVMKKLKPEYVIESGVWRGQTTWLIEQTLPNAKIFSLDPNLKKDRYISKNAKYSRTDFNFIDWSNIPKEKTLLIVDDHQDALMRVKKAKELGFLHIIFDDNCPPVFAKGAGFGDVYSCKKILSESGHFPDYTFMIKLKKILWTMKYAKDIRLVRRCFNDFKHIPANIEDKKYLENVIDTYYEFPPIFNDNFCDIKTRSFFREDSLLNDNDICDFKEFYDYREGFCGICYLKLKE